jgi:competence protein ComEC
MSSRSGRISILSLVALLILSVFAWSTYTSAGQKDGLLHVYFLNVGQGDAIFIEAPNGNQILIDGGPDGRVLTELSEVMPFYDKDIDLILATHPHIDHIAGLVDVLERYEVANVVQAKEGYDSAIFRAFQSAIVAEGAQEIEAISGKVIDLGNEVTLTILYPFKSAKGSQTKEAHEYMVVSLLKYKNFEVLLTGDMEDEVEAALIAQGINLDVDVLKVGHHGSKTSTSTALLDATTPEAAIIQVGAKNKYHHPTQLVLTRLESFGIPYYRNDIDGRIEIVSDGENFQVLK